MPKYFEFEVSLAEIAPKIWRRFLLTSQASFDDLHEAIQAACGWENTPLQLHRPRFWRTKDADCRDSRRGKPQALWQKDA